MSFLPRLHSFAPFIAFVLATTAAAAVNQDLNVYYNQSGNYLGCSDAGSITTPVSFPCPGVPDGTYTIGYQRVLWHNGQQDQDSGAFPIDVLNGIGYGRPQDVLLALNADQIENPNDGAQDTVTCTGIVGFPTGVSGVTVDGVSTLTRRNVTAANCNGATTYPTLRAEVNLRGGYQLTPDDDKICCAQCGGSSHGMARYSVHATLVSLNIEDTPFRYTSGRGPAISFTATYNQKDTQQPSVFDYSNLGPKWTFNWLSYVTDNPNNTSAPIRVYVPGGGAEDYLFNSGTQTYGVHPKSHAVVVKTSTNPLTYERQFPDGSKHVYKQSDNSASYPRRIFMSEIWDAAGNKVTINYNTQNRLKIDSLTDALGNITELAYDLPGDPLKITKVKEPTNFMLNRFAQFDYANSKLETLTDEIGIQSTVQYANGTHSITSLQTPYGTTTFNSSQSGMNSSIEIIDPETGKERVEYNASQGTGLTEPVPSGITDAGLNGNNTFYWDKKYKTLYPNSYDYDKARVTHWALNSDNTVSGIAASEKAPLENRVWYVYDGQSDSNHAGSSGRPNQVARILDDGITTQVWKYEYNSFGKVKKITDPNPLTTGLACNTRPRVTTFRYEANDIDLLNVYQQRADGASADPSGAKADLLTTYSYDPQHPRLVRTVTDAANQTTTYEYTSNGQLRTVTDANSDPTTYAYGDGSTGKPVGYVISITSPPFNGNSAVTTVTYDDQRRVQKVKYEPDNYETTTTYDKLDRPEIITFPDGTTQEFKYEQDFGSGLKKILDLTGSKDRRGRWTTRLYNGNRQMKSLTEPFGNSSTRTTTYGWCVCGLLTSITDPDNNGHTTQFEHDLRSRVTSKTFGFGTQDATTTSYVYENTTSRLKSMTDALSQTTTYDYFVDDNLRSVTYTNAIHTTPNVSFCYDLNYNRLASMNDGTAGTSYSYYEITASPPLGAGKLQSVDGPLGSDTIVYSYDSLGRVTSRSINGVSSSVAYDSLGRLDTSNNILGQFTRVYDGTTHVTPRVKTVNYPNGQTANFAYFDKLNDMRLQTLQDKTSGAVNVSKFDYANYDREGQIGDWTKTLGRSTAILSTHTYDSADELTNVVNTVSGGGSTTFTYTYDPAGNRTSDNTTANYSINSVNQITNTGYVHDLNGNMKNDGVREFEWDAANRLTAIVHPGNDGRTEFAYDGLGRRVQIVEKDGSGGIQATKKFVWDGMTIAEERDSAGGTVVKRFLPEGVQIPANASPNAKMFYSRDHLGSIRSLANENGTILSTIDYDSYGGISRAPVPSNANPEGPVITSAVSRKTHGSAGTFDVNLPLSGAPGIEMRAGYGTYTLELTFDRGVSSGTATIASGVGTVGTPIFSENTATVQLSGVTDRQTITVELDNVSGGRGSTPTQKVFVAMSVLSGDVNQNGAVTIEDINLVNGNAGAPVTASTFKYDVTFNGTINSSDVGQEQASYDGSLFPDFAFTGHYYHTRSGLYLAPYRAYNPSIGRWLGRDPIGEDGGINLYEYTNNNPVNAIDLLGQEPIPPGNQPPRFQPVPPTRLPDIRPPSPGSGGGLTTGGSALRQAANGWLAWLENYYFHEAYAACERTPRTPLGKCPKKCCIIEIYYVPFGGGQSGYLVPKHGSGVVVDETCDQAKVRASHHPDSLRPSFGEMQSVKPQYIPW
jgi:RHS repeat-associated protein